MCVCVCVCVCAHTYMYVMFNVYIINTELLGGNFKVHVLTPHHGFQRHALVTFVLLRG